VSQSFIDEVVEHANAARAELARNSVVGPFVDTSLPIPMPYLGTGEIRLVIVGQDPTVQNPRTRANVRTVLTLDRNDHLKRYLEGLCDDLGLSLSENVYATNACNCSSLRRLRPLSGSTRSMCWRLGHPFGCRCCSAS
jgi:hypothetical protein